ncbi:MAG: glutaredoxin family protein [Solirubrobacteraceae bacterium]|nr:glutaredoxin family protein [Patulibacter sp.]
MSSPKVITVLGRPGCHLCDDALDELRPIAREFGASIDEINIDLDDSLLLQHLERIPVVLVDGAELCHLFVDSTAVRAALS